MLNSRTKIKIYYNKAQQCQRTWKDCKILYHEIVGIKIIASQTSSQPLEPTLVDQLHQEHQTKTSRRISPIGFERRIFLEQIYLILILLMLYTISFSTWSYLPNTPVALEFLHPMQQ